MATNIKPTRSELLGLKKRIVLAKNGHKLLKKKRDGLIMEFFDILKKAKDLRSRLTEAYVEAKHRLDLVRLIETELYLKSLALAVTEHPTISADTRNIMGIRVPNIGTESRIQKSPVNRGYGIMTGSSLIDDAVHRYEEVIEIAISLSETETAMKKILAEIEKTKRRVNALEFAVIPGMNHAKDFITFRLEELERENISRMKHIKRRHTGA